MSETVDGGFDCNRGVGRHATYIFPLLILPSSYFPADIPLNMLNHHSKTTQVRMNLLHFLGVHLLIPFFSSAVVTLRYVRQTRNKFAAPAVSFKRIWHNISNVYLPTCDLFGMTDTNRLPRWRSKRVSKTALPPLRLPLPLSHSSLSGKATVWLLQMNWEFPYFRIQPQTIRGSWE